MAILIIEHQGMRQAGTLSGRVLIGRWPANTLVINNSAVSRIHAWIALLDGRYYVADAGSRTGTLVNGEVLRERHMLQDGDQIRVGPATLRYRTDAITPAGINAVDLSPKTADALFNDKGIFRDCNCGAPLWVPRAFTGVARCRDCGNTVNGMAQAHGEKSAKRVAVKPENTAATALAPIPRRSTALAGKLNWNLQCPKRPSIRFENPWA